MKVERHEIVATQYKKELANLLLRELKDPRIPPLTAISEVRMSPDLSHATCYIALQNYDDKEVVKNCLAGFKKAQGFIRKELARRIRLRISPELHFKIDESIAHSVNMDRVFNELKRKDEELRKRLGRDEEISE